MESTMKRMVQGICAAAGGAFEFGYSRELEVGVGSGLSLPAYAAGVHVTGVDISQDMLSRAARRAQNLDGQVPVTLVRMDAQRLAFPDAAFGKAVVTYAASGFPCPADAISGDPALLYLTRPTLPGALRSFTFASVVTPQSADQASAYQVPRPAPWRVMWPPLVSRLK
jgi:SAM-dependent methyltransferase